VNRSSLALTTDCNVVGLTRPNLSRVLMRALALLFNAFPVRWQRRFLNAAHARFLVGVTGLGIDAQGHVVLARHRFGAPQWRFLGGFLAPKERVQDALAREVREETGLVIEVGPILEVTTGHRWQRVEIVFAYRIPDALPKLSDELVELGSFDPSDLPDVRADQRGLIERHAATAAAWARGPR
jgi:ADP-ribose pyrophosphatase YjhB (NUDIX family)